MCHPLQTVYVVYCLELLKWQALLWNIFLQRHLIECWTNCEKKTRTTAILIDSNSNPNTTITYTHNPTRHTHLMWSHITTCYAWFLSHLEHLILSAGTVLHNQLELWHLDGQLFKCLSIIVWSTAQICIHMACRRKIKLTKIATCHFVT